MSGRSTTAPQASGGLVARERLELRGAAALADEALLTILVARTALTRPACSSRCAGRCSSLAHESIGDSPRASTTSP